MIFAAGLGTRLAPLTSDRPKALVELWGKPLLRHVIEKLAGEGFLSITVNVHHFAEQIIEYLNTPEFRGYCEGAALKIEISDESARLLDTGGGLKHAASILFARDSDPVLIHNVDILSNARLSALYSQIGDADALLLVSPRDTARYLLFSQDMRLVGWENIRTGEVRTPCPDLNPGNCKCLAFSGIHVVSRRLVDAMQNWPDKFSITDFYIQMCRELNIRGFEDRDLRLVDVGKIDVLRRLERQAL